MRLKGFKAWTKEAATKAVSAFQKAPMGNILCSRKKKRLQAEPQSNVEIDNVSAIKG